MLRTTNVVMLIVCIVKASAEDNIVFWPARSSFYEGKTLHFEHILTLKGQKSAGDICFGLTSTQNSLKTQLTRKSELREYSQHLISCLLPIPNKAIERAPFFCFGFLFQLCLKTYSDSFSLSGILHKKTSSWRNEERLTFLLPHSGA